MDDAATMLTIGQLAQRTGLPVRTIRYWSDIGAVPPAGRTGRDHRRYDAAAVARLELVATLRELGLGLAEVRRVLDRQATVAEVAATHVEALDAQIRTLRLRRAVLATVARRKPGNEEMTLMNKLATLSAQERKQIIDDFVDEVFAGLEPDTGLAAHLRRATPDLPDDPSPEQVDAWVELAELVQDPGFRRRIRAMAEQGARARAADPATEDDEARTPEFVARVLEHAGPGRASREWHRSPGKARPCWTSSWPGPRVTSTARSSGSSWRRARTPAPSGTGSCSASSTAGRRSRRTCPPSSG